MLKRQLLERAYSLLVATLLAIPCFAQERGPAIFSDSFDTPMTFAENWIPEKGSKISFEDGKVLFSLHGIMQMKRDTPVNFYAEMELAFLDKNDPDGNSRAGFEIDGKYFLISPKGNVFTWPYPAIADFETGKPVKLTLIRKCSKESADYVFLVNGKEFKREKASLPKEILDALGAAGEGAGMENMTGRSKPLKIFAYKTNVVMDNFQLCSVNDGKDDSSNVVINSSFEHEQDGFPLYFSRNWWAFNLTQPRPYEDYIAAWSLDKSEKHSGEQSLRIVFDDTTAGGPALSAWGAATVKDMPGVFSVWMKADREDFPVAIAYGKGKEVMVGKEWKRYEVVNPKLPNPGGVYSPVTISFSRKQGTLWMDDLQAEILSGLDEEKLKAGETFATPYKPSQLDKQKFAKKENIVPVRTPEISIPKLPAGVLPSKNLDEWKDKATKSDQFYHAGQTPKNKTELYLACDDANLYVGYRCYMKKALSQTVTSLPHDSSSIYDRDSVELFLDPAAKGTWFQMFCDYSGSRLEADNNRDRSWNGDWKSVVTVNEKTSSVDYVITLPLFNFASPEMKSRWLVNFCRNDRSNNEFPSLAKPPRVAYTATGYWPYARFPEEVVKTFMLGATTGSFADVGDGVAISLPVQNRTGGEHAVEAELYDLQNSGILIGKQNVTLKTEENILSFDSKLKTQKVCLKLTGKGKTLCEQTVVLEKSSPVSILGHLSYYMNEPEALFKVKTNLADPQKMTAILKCAERKVETPASANFKIAFPLKDIPDGTHDVTLALMKDGKVAGSASTNLVKRPFKKGAAQINRFTRSLIHDGKPIFPVMPFTEVLKTWTKQQAEAIVEFLEKNGFRYALYLAEPKAEKQIVWFMDEAKRKDIRIMLWGGYNALTDEAIPEFVKKIDYPNVFSQLVMDEPELSIPSDKARDFLRKMRPYFPYQPVHMNYTVLGIPGRYANLESDILMLDDYLTNNENRTVASVVSNVDTMWKAGEEEGKPCYYFITGGNMPLHFKEPSYAEQIAQTYGCIAAGCTGLGYFYGRPVTPGNWKALIQLNKEIMSLNDILLSEEETPSAQSTSNAKLLRSITRKHAGYLYIVSCNIDENQAGEVTFTLPAEYKYGSSAEVLFENRKVDVKDGKFSDTFPGYSRHVYKVKAWK